MIPYNTNGDVWTFFIPETGKIFTVFSNDSRMTAIQEAVLNEDEVKLLELLKMDETEFAVDQVKEYVNSVSFGNLKFEEKVVDGVTVRATTYKTRILPDVLSNYLFNLYNEGCEKFDHYFKFLDNILNNPSDRARNELYSFLASRHLPITDNGTFIAYKGVSKDMWSIHGNTDTRVLSGTVDKDGHILNNPGDVITVVTEDVDTNCHNYCSCGLHVGTWEYASSFGSVVVAVEVNPADVVSVPLDCSCEKCRVSSYKVLQVIAKQFNTTDVVVSNDVAEETNNTPRGGSKGTIAERIRSVGFGNICEDIDRQLKRNGGKTTVRQLTKSVGRKYGLGDKAIEMVCVLLHLGYKVDETEPALGKRTVTAN